MTRRIGWLVCVILCWSFLGSADARIPPWEDRSYLFAMNNTSWFAKIAQQDGRERLDISVPLPNQPNAGWIIAVPAPLEQVDLKWSPGFPVYAGKWPSTIRHELLETLPSYASYTQFYPVLFLLLRPTLGRTAEIAPSDTKPIAGKSGVECSLHNVHSREELSALIQSAAMAVPDYQIESLRRYVDSRHSFLFISVGSRRQYEQYLLAHRASVSWSSRAEDVPCLHIEFPASQPIMPLVATGNSTSNGNFAQILGYADVSGGDAGSQGMAISDFRSFADSARHEPSVPYTRVMYSSMVDETRFQLQTGAAFTATDDDSGRLSSPWMYYPLFITWVAICSFFSGSVAGLAAGRRWYRYGLLGIWNLGTIFTLYIATRRSEIFDDAKGPLSRKFYLYIFSAVFVLLNVALNYVI